jgi:hypothetical protein
MTAHRRPTATTWMRIARAIALLLPTSLTAATSGSLPLVARSQPPEQGAERPLPWSRPESSETQGVASRKLLELYGIRGAELARFRDDGRLVPEEEPLLLQILYRLGRLPAAEIASWAKPVESWQALLANPREYRVLTYSLEGNVTAVRRRDVLPALRESLEFSEYFAVDMQIRDGPAVTLFALRIPQAWLHSDALPAPATANGLLIEAGRLADQPESVVFAAGRVAWHPDRTLPARGITKSHCRLAANGVDIGLFDDLQNSQGQELTARDQSLFYQLLSAARRENTMSIPAAEAAPLDLGNYLLHPADYQGRLTRFTADVRRVTRIAVNDSAAQQQLGTDHYFELDLTIGLGDQPIRLQGKDAARSPVYTGKYPATCCVIHLPPELEQLVRAAREQEGRTLINERVELSAYFFKLWAYQSDYVSSFDPEQYQLSPLFIGTTVDVAEALPAPRVSLAGYVFAAIFLCCLAALWISVWRTQRRDRRMRERAARPPILR